MIILQAFISWCRIFHSPQPNSTWEKDVKLEFDRRGKTFGISCFVFCSANCDEIIAYDLDGLSVSFVEDYNFSLALLCDRGDLTKLPMLVAELLELGVIPGHNSSCPLLYFRDMQFVSLFEIQNTTPIF